MNKTEISARQMEVTVALFLTGSSIVSSGASDAKQDTWITILLAFALSIPLIWVHSEILQLYPGRNYFGNILRTLGGPVGKAVSVLLLLFYFHLGALVLRIFTEFIHIVNMTDTPAIAISVFMTAAGVYVLSNRLYVLTRICKFTFPLLMVAVALTILLSLKNMNLNYLRPVLNSGWQNLTRGTLATLSVTYGELIVCAPMFGELDRRNQVFPVFFRGALWGFLVLLIADLRNLLVLGYSAGTFAFPSYEAVSIVKLGDFFTRIEVLIGINLLLAGFIKTSVLLFTACKGLAEVFHLGDYEPLAAPCSLLILTLSELVYNNMEEMFSWDRYFTYYSIPFQILLPVLVLIVGKIRKKLQKPGKAERQTPSPKPQES